jgi:hypothetical protein
VNYKERDLWPTKVYAAEYPAWREDKDALVGLCRRLQQAGASWGIAARAKAGIYESTPDLFTKPEAQGLVQFCGELIGTIFHADVSFPESWCHVTNDGGYHDAHAHVDYARSGICGIYYLQCEECTGDPPNGINRFYSPDPFQPVDVADIVPIEGRVILFPGHIRHAALPYRGEQDRIVISFNARLHASR